MLNTKSIINISFLFTIMILPSCANKKKIIYFQGDEAIKNESNTKNITKYQTNDILNITVLAKDAEAAKPFNLNSQGNFSNDKTINSNNSTSIKGYLIDQNGEIDFPVIGKISIAGSNKLEVEELLKSKLKEYINDPVVHIELLNFKVTILGDVNKPGIYRVDNERLTIIELIGMAGDLNITGKRKNVLVIREVNGIKSETRVDLTSKEIFSSPVYYLQQNDVVYIEPNQPKKNTAAINPTAITLILSFTTLGITLLNLILR
jgi:polysaccharide export outer membrane protein